MATLHITRGLPGSGKSTWAMSVVVAQKPGSVVRINRDDLRFMMNGGYVFDENNNLDQGAENAVTMVQRTSVITLLKVGIDVIVDDTNLPHNAFNSWKMVAQEAGANFEVKDFRDVPLETCITRDAQRDRVVGEEVIRGMYRKYVEGGK